jgi:hypothetical protein
MAGGGGAAAVKKAATKKAITAERTMSAKPMRKRIVLARGAMGKW